MRIRFLSKNKYKIEEAKTILEPLGVDVIPVTVSISELQTSDVGEIVRDKILRAFGQIGHRLFVEQTCLYLDALNGFPGGLTQPFWDALEADRFCELFGRGDRPAVTASTWIGYCDGQQVHHFKGEIRGSVASEPRGKREFQWDCVFIPDGYNETFAEMGERKNEISMRRIALNRFADHLRGAENA
nr:non-canonical purine NTP pyrophosphatase [Nitratireductor aquibiodomus]